MSSKRWMPVMLGAVAIVALMGAVRTSPIMAGRSAGSPAVTSKPPLDQILGLSPGMPEPEAREHLRRLGERAAALAGRTRDGQTRELWEVHDATYACVLVGFEGSRVRVVRGFVRARGRGLRYAEVGDPKAARRLDGSAMEWEIRSGHGEPALTVTARGTDPFLAGSVAIRRAD